MNDNKNIINLHEKKEHDVYGKKIEDIRKNGGGGGGDMSKYVTRDEFNDAIKDLTHQLETNQVNLLSKFEVVQTKIDSVSETIPDKLKIALYEKSIEDRKETVETRRYVLGTLIIGLLGIVISLLS